MAPKNSVRSVYTSSSSSSSLSLFPLCPPPSFPGFSRVRGGKQLLTASFVRRSLPSFPPPYAAAGMKAGIGQIVTQINGSENIIMEVFWETVMYLEVFWGDVLLNSIVGRRDGLRGEWLWTGDQLLEQSKRPFFFPPPTPHTNSRRFKIPPGPHWRDGMPHWCPNQAGRRKRTVLLLFLLVRLIFVGIRLARRERWDFASSLNPPRIGFAFPSDIIWSASFGAVLFGELAEAVAKETFCLSSFCQK